MRKTINCIVLLGFVLVFLLASGCAYKSINHGTEITQDQTLKIIDGKTSRNQILSEFGDPSKTMNNEKAYFYSWTRGSKGHFLGFGSGSAYSHSLVVIF